MSVDELYRQLETCLSRDRGRLSRQIGDLKRNRGRSKKVQDAIKASQALRDERAKRLPVPTFDDELPVAKRREEIAEAIRTNQVIVLCGETGSGKSTQLPKICLSLGRGASGLIGHTQPRRIAARSVAARVAEELGEPLGRAVGFKIRFTDAMSDRSFVKVMTDGVLLAETQSDHFLGRYDTIIIDEAHERSLNIDFLLGYLKQILPRRRDLKVIITSATIDPERLSEHFDDAPIIEVSGRTYPVEVIHEPIEQMERDVGLADAICDSIERLAMLDTPGASGDVLVFLSGEREIRETAQALRNRMKEHAVGSGPSLCDAVLPLYARLSMAEQQRVFAPHRGRRVVLATNVAETSLTVPGIRYVIDPGFARVSRYSARGRVQRLPIEPISQASAEQRKGRCGRIGPGVCVRLYSEQDYEAREAFTPPEILRSSLAGVILRMKAIGLGEIESFPFVEPPKPTMVREGHETLREIGAINEKGELTRIGRILARLPIDPRIGRMIVAADSEGCLHEVLIIASALSVQDPRFRPMDRRDAADEAHAQFRHERSDFLSYLNIWEFYHERLRTLSRGRARKACEQNFLSPVRLREWQEVHVQLTSQAREAGLKMNATPADYESVHRALLSGLLINVGRKGEQGEYEGVRGRRFRLFPGSGQAAGKPGWIMSAEIVETARVYAHTVAGIDPAWIERVGKPLLKRSHSNPRWDVKTQSVRADEKVTLLGLTIIPKRSVEFGRVDPRAARELFIHHALVEGEFRTRGKFFEHNQRLLEQVQALEAKQRRTDLLADSVARFGFFDRLVPPDVSSGSRFERWRKDAERSDPKLLFMNESDVLVADPEVDTALYPDSLDLEGARGELEYRFEPGEEHDGVTLHVPVSALIHTSEAKGSWVVPGLVEEKARELIRGLPKVYRRNFDAPTHASEFAARVIADPSRFESTSMHTALTDFLASRTGVRVPGDAWNDRALPPHLRLRVRVSDAEGQTLAQSRDIASIRRDLADHTQQALRDVDEGDFNRIGLVTWDFGSLPEHVDVGPSVAPIRAYPALADEDGEVALRLFPNRIQAGRAMRAGLRRLALLSWGEDVRHLGKGLPGFDAMSMRYAPIGTAGQLREQIVLLIIERAALSNLGGIRTGAQFESAIDVGRGNVGNARREVCELVSAILAQYQAASLRLSGDAPPAWENARGDVRNQVTRLLYPGSLTETSLRWIRHVPRYLAGAEYRLARLTGDGLSRDQRAASEFAPWAAHLIQGESALKPHDFDPELETFRWMLEEYRISLFAQELRTAIPVSPRRLREQWGRVGQEAT